MPLARCRCGDGKNYRGYQHHGLARGGAMRWASHKNRRRRELEFSIIFLSQSRCPMSEMSAVVDPIIHSPHTLVVPAGRPRSSGSREEGAKDPSDIGLFLHTFSFLESWCPPARLVPPIRIYYRAPQLPLN